MTGSSNGTFSGEMGRIEYESKRAKPQSVDIADASMGVWILLTIAGFVASWKAGFTEIQLHLRLAEYLINTTFNFQLVLIITLMLMIQLALI